MVHMPSLQVRSKEDGITPWWQEVLPRFIGFSHTKLLPVWKTQFPHRVEDPEETWELQLVDAAVYICLAKWGTLFLATGNLSCMDQGKFLSKNLYQNVNQSFIVLTAVSARICTSPASYYTAPCNRSKL